MNFTGKLEGLKMDYVTRKQSLSLEVNEDARDAFQELKDCEKLVIQIKKYRKKRSLDANAYYWVLITKLARRLELSNPEMHNMCLERYGQLEIMENKAVFVTIPDTEEAENKDLLLIYLQFNDSQKKEFLPVPRSMGMTFFDSINKVLRMRKKVLRT